LVAAVDGEVLLEGVSWNGIRAMEWRTRVSYLHQKSVLFPGTVQANLEKPFVFGIRAGRSPDLRLAEEYLGRLLLAPAILNRDALTLSVGEASRVALVRGLLADPQVLLLDEPSAALDPAANEAMASLLSDWVSGEVRGIVATAHDREIIRRLPGAEIEMALECREL
jgi:putative ABC transport system ATP-binding protein